MTTLPVLSIVLTPTTDRSQVSAALTSILAVNQLDLEVLVVGVPSAGTDTILRTFADADDRVRLLPDSTRDAGLALARGEYVAFPNPAGQVTRDGYGRLVSSLEATGSELATGILVPVLEPKDRLQEPILGFEFDAPRTVAGLADVPALAVDLSLANKVFRRSFLDTAGLGFADTSTGGEALTSLTAFRRASAVDLVATPVAFAPETAADTSKRAVKRWATRTANALSLLPAGALDEARTIFAGRTLRYAITTIFPGLAGAGDELGRRCAAVVSDLVEAAPPGFLAEYSPHSRWELALLILGHPHLIPAVRRPDDRSGLRIPPGGLDGPLPEALRASLGLGDSTVGEAFRTRFLEHGPHPRPLGDQVAEFTTDPPEVSVVVPAHNVAPYIDELLRSLRAAVGVRLEFIVVDDHSTDGTWDVLQRHAEEDPRVRAVRSPGRGGGQARNYGIELARGEYLAFSDSDDIVPPGAYALMLDAARTTGADLTTGDFVKLTSTSIWASEKKYGYGTRLSGIQLHDQPLLLGHRACWNRLVRREFWLEHMLPFPGVPRSNDIVPLTSALTASPRITVVPDIVYVYRVRPGEGSMRSAVGQVASTASYLAEETTCARLVEQTGDEVIRRSYWSMVLRSDTWFHLWPYVAALAPDEPIDPGVAARYRDLTDLAPSDSFRRLGPGLQGFHALIRAGRGAEASALAGTLKGEPPDLAMALAVLEQLAATHEVSVGPLGVLVESLLIRRLVEEPAEATPDLAARAVELLSSLRGAVVPTLPGTADDRVARVLQNGTAADLLAVLNPGEPPAATLRLSLRTGVIEGRTTRSGRGRWLVATPAGDPDRPPIVVSAVERTDNGWRARLDPGDLGTGRWGLHLESEDDWGRCREPLTTIATTGPRVPVLRGLTRLAAVRRPAGSVLLVRDGLATRVRRVVGRVGRRLVSSRRGAPTPRPGRR